MTQTTRADLDQLARMIDLALSLPPGSHAIEYAYGSPRLVRDGGSVDVSPRLPAGELARWVRDHGKLPVPNFAAGGVATPADAALCMMLGAESVFVGSGIFKSEDPAHRAKAVVKAVTHWQEPAVVLEVSRGLEGAMRGLDVAKLTPEEMLSRRGW